jgi:oligopeptide/dipeptide ABC transporter ATP-binding protein
MSKETILEVKNLYKYFPVGKSGIWSSGKKFVHAVDGASFELGRGEILALAGESGCGKSTLALTLMSLEKPTRGDIQFEGRSVTNLKPRGLKELRRHIQMVFQDPYESLDPLMSIKDIVSEPLEVHGLTKDKNEKMRRVTQAVEDAGLRPADIYLNRLPHELSGGQRQRVVVAGAMVLEPAVLLADEPVSMLDVSIRAEILNLLSDLRESRGISVIFITHDLATAASLCDRIAVMYLGRIVEIGPTLEVLSKPSHPYTKALLSVIPIPNPRHRRRRIILQGAPPNAIEIPTGCRFHPRCPVVFDKCKVDDPQLMGIKGAHQAACWLKKPY